MSTIHASGPAFPIVAGNEVYSLGVSLRDWFATHALGMGFDWTNLHETGGYDEAATVAYEIADAMLKAREGGTP
ncbi:hypothetical protein ATER59S_02382 [Aquamicrobium terrae]